MGLAIELCERGLSPDGLTRIGIRKLLRQRLAETDLGSDAANLQQTKRLVDLFCDGPIALVPEKANDQHYELPEELFGLMLGPHRKYSSCVWDADTVTLEDAEKLALETTCERAQLSDGQQILELGCGWGSLTMYVAAKYPNAKITAVSNSASQRDYIMRELKQRDLNNVTVITCDMNDLELSSKFNRVVSVEMFEHMRNYRELLQRISSWLEQEGKLFVHIFCHKTLTYEFQDKTSNDWMSRYFFSGGIMPGENFLSHFGEHLTIETQWRWSGVNYQRTCEAWLDNMRANRDELMEVMRKTYGNDANRWFQRWRMFHLACSELFGFAGGNEWFVSHYLLKHTDTFSQSAEKRK